MSGQTAVDPTTGRVEASSFEDEVQQALRNLERAIDAAGGRLADTVKVNAYLADVEGDFGTFNRIYGEFFSHPLPARTTLQATPPLGARFEIDAVVAARTL